MHGQGSCQITLTTETTVLEQETHTKGMEKLHQSKDLKIDTQDST